MAEIKKTRLLNKTLDALTDEDVFNIAEQVMEDAEFFHELNPYAKNKLIEGMKNSIVEKVRDGLLTAQKLEILVWRKFDGDWEKFLADKAQEPTPEVESADDPLAEDTALTAAEAQANQPSVNEAEELRQAELGYLVNEANRLLDDPEVSLSKAIKAKLRNRTSIKIIGQGIRDAKASKQRQLREAEEQAAAATEAEQLQELFDSNPLHFLWLEVEPLHTELMKQLALLGMDARRGYLLFAMLPYKSWDDQSALQKWIDDVKVKLNPPAERSEVAAKKPIIPPAPNPAAMSEEDLKAAVARIVEPKSGEKGTPNPMGLDAELKGRGKAVAGAGKTKNQRGGAGTKSHPGRKGKSPISA